MFAVVDKQDHVVVYLLAHPPEIDADGMRGEIWASDITSEGYEVVEADPPPGPCVGRAWRYNGAWEVIDQQLIDEEATREVQRWRLGAVVDMRQARLALLAAGKLADVDAAIAELPSPQREAVQIEWEYGTRVRRTSPLVINLMPALGIDDVEMDQLFRAAMVL